MNHVKFAPRVLAMGLLAASALSIPAFAAPADGSSTAIRVDRDPAPNSASQSVSANDSPVPVDPSQATGEIEVVYQDANGKEHSATISAVAAQAENYACINAGGDPLRVRQGPGTNYGILCSVYDGDRFPITGKTNGWYQILCNGRTGYVSAEFVVVQDNDTVTKPDGDGSDISPNPLGQEIVEYALQYVGYPYVYGTAGPNTFDCSGFTYYVYSQFGYTLNRSSRDQVKNGVAISKEDLQQGDLVFFSTNGQYPTHVGLYIGDNNIVHASPPPGRGQDQQSGHQLLHGQLFRRPSDSLSAAAQERFTVENPVHFKCTGFCLCSPATLPS